MLVLIEFMRNPADWAHVYSVFFVVSRLWNSMDQQRWLLVLISKQHVVNTVFIRSATTFLSSLAGRLFRMLVLKVRIVKDPATEISDCHQWRIGSTHIHTLSIPRVHGARWDQHQILKYTIPSVTETVWTRHPNRDVLAFCINKHKIQSIMPKTIHIILLFK